MFFQRVYFVQIIESQKWIMRCPYDFKINICQIYNDIVINTKNKTTTGNKDIHLHKPEISLNISMSTAVYKVWKSGARNKVCQTSSSEWFIFELCINWLFGVLRRTSILFTIKRQSSWRSQSTENYIYMYMCAVKLYLPWN